MIDFIDMVLESNRDLVLRRLLECLGRDRTKHQVAEVTSLGLVQMTRKRVGQGLLESFSEPCVHCNGRGVIVHMEQPTAPGGGGGPVGTSGETATAGSKRRRRGKGGAAHEEPQPHLLDEELAGEAEEAEEHDHEHEEFEIVSGGEQLVIDVPQAEPVEAAAEATVVETVVAEPERPSLVEIPAAPAAGGRVRRRAVRKATAPAGAPAEAEIVVLQARADAAMEAALAAAAPAETVEVVEVVETAEAVEVPEVTAPAEAATEAEAEAEEAPAPKKRAPRKAAAKKTATAAKKTTTTAAAAKKTTARKPATKRTSAAAKKAAAAEGDSAAE